LVLLNSFGLFNKYKWYKYNWYKLLLLNFKVIC